MRYLLLGFLITVLLVVIVAGPRGRHSTGRPLEFFPDMVRQSKVKPQSTSGFFADGVGPRRPVQGAVPMGFEMPKQTAFKRIRGGDSEVQTAEEHERLAFTEGPTYYDTGMMGDQWGTGIPLEVTPELMEKGRERFTINCAVCHGATGSGNGVTSQYGLANIANYHLEKYLKMADGEIYYTITNGHNSMNGYGANITVHDRWAIVCYIRALQKAQEVQFAELTPDQQKVVNAKP
ncbi:MAG: cytochrome c [Rhodospirillales bacterium]|nr:cytochrome c [Acetobacter sp.]